MAWPTLRLFPGVRVPSTRLALGVDMTASFVHRVGILVVVATLFACASAPCPPPRFAEYSLDASEHPESIDCFYACLKVEGEASKRACFARCDGVVERTTRSPCSKDAPALCRSYAVEEPESCDDPASDVALDVLAFAIDSAIDAADDDDAVVTHDQQHSPERTGSRKQKSASPSPSKKWTSSSSKIAAPPSSFRSKAKKR